jgi:hypothetical protein
MSKISLKHSGGNVVSLNSPSSAPTSADVAFKLPNQDGSANEFLKTDGSGNLSFGAVTDNNSWVKLSKTTITSSTAEVDFTNSITGAFDTYKIYVVTITDLRGATDDVTLRMRIFNSSGIYTTANYRYVYHAFADGDYNYTGQSEYQIVRHGIGNQTSGSVFNQNLSAILYLYNFENNKRHQFHGNAVYKSNNNATQLITVGGTIDEGTATTGLRFYMSSGNIATAEFTLYGIKS